MKYIFRINNYTVYYISKLIIEKYKLCSQDCIFFVERELKIPESNSIKTFRHSLLAENLFSLSSLEIIKEIRRFDNSLATLIGNNNFSFFGFNYSRHIVQLFITNKRCKKVYQLEEGLACYKSKDFLLNLFRKKFTYKRKVFNHIFLSNRLKPIGSTLENADGYFTISEFAYLGFQPKICLKIPTKKSEFQVITNSFIIVLDSATTIGKLDFGVHLGFLEFLIRELKKTGKNILIKFHPIQDNKEKTIIKKEFDSIVRFLPDDFILESLIFSTKTNIFLGFVSSILLYSSFAGCQSYTYFNYPLINNSIRDIELPDIFTKKVKDIRLLVKTQTLE